jgi:hypothetical protein
MRSFWLMFTRGASVGLSALWLANAPCDAAEAPQNSGGEANQSVFLPNETFRVAGEANAYRLRRPGQTAFQPAGGLNIGVPSGTTVATENRTVNVVLNEAADVILLPNTEVTLSFFTRGITLCIARGKVDCLVNRERWRGKYFSVAYSNLVATATGTHFVFEVQGHSVQADVYDGSIEVFVTHTGGTAPNNVPAGFPLSTPLRIRLCADGRTDASDATWEPGLWDTGDQSGLHFRGQGYSVSSSRGCVFEQRPPTEREVFRDYSGRLVDERAPDWRQAVRGHPVSDEQRQRLEAAREQCRWQLSRSLQSVQAGREWSSAFEADRNMALMNYFAIIAEVCGVNPLPRGRRFRAEDYDCDRIRREVIPPIRYVVEVSNQPKNSDGMREVLEFRDIPQLGARKLLEFLEGAVADNQISAEERRHLQDVLDRMADLVDAPDTPVPTVP